MITKGIKTVAVVLVVLMLGGALLFGGDMISYVKSGTHTVRESVKGAIPTEFELGRARDLLDDIIPEMQANIRLMAAEEVEIAALTEDIAQGRKRMIGEQASIEKLSGMLSTGVAGLILACMATADCFGRVQWPAISEHLRYDRVQVALIKHKRLGRIRRDIGSEADSDGAAADAMLTDIWERLRPSCPKRSTIGAHLLGTLDAPWSEYVAFHLGELGCRFCLANLDDLQRQTAGGEQTRAHRRIMESTVGFLRHA